ncbi:SDR family oxidoreductase [Listeria sp. FSL L7-1485]|uniref:SDR family oxidoreductase n=1 Tax=Listeria immobilis TaxID=2713502 RepID=A0A7X1C8D2_9LIST|nr:SDR family oxidoreductase [Listeria immobilis]MBC1484154.1 SDR family oxidoreductase [Listeria immobilis]MBC1488163.1 SDR family oxidoreductase [Listeria immobilis]MBC1508082.1 SDR family oxidoreductase [Listeria immobilis]MBC1511062.1 SDR family oxidoreductase [Listeria immobilis]MBC1517143.1 SDR family oxidoreductase [Listeria immobilis]
MNVLVIGANGKIGRHLVKKLALEKGFFVRAMVRKAEQVAALEKLGAKPIIADLKKDFIYAYDEIEAVIFTAGSGGHTPPEETIKIDQDGAIKAIEFAKERGIRRFILVSSYGADNPENGPDSLVHYLKAKAKADEVLKRSRLEYTIVRPVGLSDDAGTGKIAEVSGTPKTSIPREDVATFITEALSQKSSFYKTYTIESGETPITNFFN